MEGAALCCPGALTQGSDWVTPGLSKPTTHLQPPKGTLGTFFISSHPKSMCIVFTFLTALKKISQFKPKDNISQGFSCLQIFALSYCSHPAHRGLGPQLAGGFVALLVGTIRKHKQVLFFVFSTQFLWEKRSSGNLLFDILRCQGRHHFQALWHVV